VQWVGISAEDGAERTSISQSRGVLRRVDHEAVASRSVSGGYLFGDQLFAEGDHGSRR
jgi:hypothetical protein